MTPPDQTPQSARNHGERKKLSEVSRYFKSTDEGDQSPTLIRVRSNSDNPLDSPGDKL
jgi:hypothetical protein